MKIHIHFFLFSFLFLASNSQASSRYLTYQGRILDSNLAPLEYEATQFKFEIVSPDGTCVLYKETTTPKDMRNSNGIFDVSIGDGTVDPGVASDVNIETVFKNGRAFNCLAGGVYNALDGHNRKLRVSFRDSIGWKMITPDQEIRSVPYASYAQNAASAQKLGNSSEADFLKLSTVPFCAAGSFLSHVSPTGTFVCDTPIINSGTIGGSTVVNTTGYIQTSAGLRLYSGSNFVEFKAPASIPSSYVLRWPSSAGAAGQALVTDGAGNLSWTAVSSSWSSLSGTPTSLAGYGITDALSNSLADSKILIGSSSNIATPTSVSGDATLSNTGVLTLSNSGASAGTYSKVTVDTKGRVTLGANLGASDITTALGFTPINKAGDILTGSLGLGNYTNTTEATLTSGWGTGDKGKTWFNTSTNQVKYWDGSSAVALGVSGIGLNTLNGQTGTSQNFAIGSTGTAPAFSSGSNTHTLNIPMAANAGVTAGLLSKTDYDSFNSKLDSASTFSGDVSGTSATMSVDKIKGSPLVLTTPASGQYLKFDGTNWINSILSVNLASDVTGTLAVANGGTGATSLGSGNILIGSGTGAVSSLNSGMIGNVVYSTGASSWASGTPETAGLVDKSSTQTISGAKAFSNYVQMNAQNEVRFADADSSNFVSIRAPANVGTNLALTLPSTAGTSGQVLSTDGTGVLSWTTPSSGISGSGTTNKIPMFTGASALGDSPLSVSSTNVGIGTNSPSWPLDIQSSSAFQARLYHASENASDGSALMMTRTRGTVASGTAVQSGDTIGGFYFRAHDGSSTGTTSAAIEVSASQTHSTSARGTIMTFETASTGATTRSERMRITSNGNVGIGVTSAPDLLTVGSTSVANNQLLVQSASPGVPSLKLQNSFNYLWMGLNSSGSTSNGIPTNNAGFAVGNIAMVFATGATATERMRITNVGNVGIGTTTPATTLDLKATATTGGTNMVTTTTPVLTLNKAAAGDSSAIRFSNNGTITWALGDQYGSSFQLWNANTSSYNWTILNNGNMGVGVATPTANLHVKGAINDSQMSIANTSYVGHVTIPTNANGLILSGGTKYTAGNWIADSTSSGVITVSSNGLLFFTSSGNTIGNTQVNNVRMGISPNGQVSIGSAAGTGWTNSSQLTIGDHSSNSSVIAFRRPAATANLDIYTNYEGSDAGKYFGYGFQPSTGMFRFWDSAAGARMDFTNSSGNMWIAGTYSNGSDARLKKDIKQIPDALNKILRINGVTYHWRSGVNNDPSEQIGVIAQQVEKVFPQAVKESQNGFKSVTYGNLIAPIIESIKELYQKMLTNDQELEKKLAEATQENETLKMQIHDLDLRMKKMEERLELKH